MRERFQKAMERHLHISREVSKHFLKMGKRETSTIISQEVVLQDGGNAHLHTTIQLLPIRRMYTHGTELIEDDYLSFEMKEDIEA